MLTLGLCFWRVFFVTEVSGLQAVTMCSQSQLSPGLQVGRLLQHLLAQVLQLAHVEELHDDGLQLLSSLLGQTVPGGDQGPGRRPHPAPVVVLVQTDHLLAALRGGVLLGQLLLQKAVVHVGGGVAAGTQQQDVVGVVVLHLHGEVTSVLVRNHVFPARRDRTLYYS